MDLVQNIEAESEDDAFRAYDHSFNDHRTTIWDLVLIPSEAHSKMTPTPNPTPVTPTPVVPVVPPKVVIAKAPGWSLIAGGAVLASILIFGGQAIAPTGCSYRPKPLPPVPVPVIAKGHYHVTYIYDSGQLSQVTGALVADPTIKADLAADPYDSDWRTYEATSQDLANIGFGNAAKIVPNLVIQDANGTVIPSGSVPVDKSGVLTKIKALRGIK